MKRAWITGASSGIGKAIAEKLAAAGCDLILTARREDRLQALKASLGNKVDVTVAAFDIRDAQALGKFVDENRAKLESTDVLINNAGLAIGTAKLMDGDPTDWDTMLDTNVRALLRVTRAVLPLMVKAKNGHVVNLGSVAGRWVYPGGAVYCATKFAVRALSDGLRMDLAGTPVRVTNIEPGMVETEFSEVRFKDADKAKSVYKDMTPLTAEDIAETVVWCLQRPKHVNIQELVIFPTDQAAIQMVHRHEK